MRRIELWSVYDPYAGPPKVDSAYITTVEILTVADEDMPKVVLWGSHVYLLSGVAVREGVPWVYQEVAAMLSFTPMPGLPRGSERIGA